MDFFNLNLYKSRQFDSNLEKKNSYFMVVETLENIERVKILNSFKVNSVDEITDI